MANHDSIGCHISSAITAGDLTGTMARVDASVNDVAISTVINHQVDDDDDDDDDSARRSYLLNNEEVANEVG